MRTWVAALAMLPASVAAGQGFAGSYSTRTADGVATLKLAESGEAVKGVLSLDGETTQFAGRRAGGRVTGVVTDPESGAKVGFTIVRQSRNLVFTYNVVGADGQPVRDASQTLVFVATGASGAATGKAASRKAVPAGGRPAAGGAVLINGVRISAGELGRLAKKYGRAIPPGNYWYDRRTGAWGNRGGPTLGFTVVGLSLGGKIRADASGGDTGVYVNGRELHRIDVLSLQRYGVPVARGRWWVDGQFNFGQEGRSAVLGNLVQIVRQASGKAYGGTYSSRTGVSTASDGEGGFMATVPDGHGGSIGWYSGK